MCSGRSTGLQNAITYKPKNQLQGPTISEQLPPAPNKSMQFKQDLMTGVLDIKRSENPTKAEVIASTLKNKQAPKGTTVSGQQKNQSVETVRKPRRTVRIDKRSGTNSLRIPRNTNTGSGNLNY